MNYATYIFDCDGVLLNSNSAKSNAFLSAAINYGNQKAAELVAFHQQAGGISRRARWDHYFANILNQPGDLETALADCTRLATEGIRGCQKVPGIEAYLERLTARKIVVSGVEAGELADLLNAHGLLKHFAAVWGGPKHKSTILKWLLESGEIETPAVYFGDTKDDYESASAAGIEFVFVSGCSEWEAGGQFAAEHDIRSIADFRELLGEDQPPLPGRIP